MIHEVVKALGNAGKMAVEALLDLCFNLSSEIIPSKRIFPISLREITFLMRIEVRK